MTNQSHKKAITIVVTTLSIVVLLPLTLFITNLLLNRPKVSKDSKMQPKINDNKDDLLGVINQGIALEYTKPDKSWNHKIVKSEVNPEDKLLSQEIEISNGMSTISVVLVEVDNRYLRYAIGNPNYTINPLNTSMYGYVEKVGKELIEFTLNPAKRYQRISNVRLGNGMIIIDPALKKDNLYQSSLLLFPEYQNNKKSQELQVQITYNQDSDKNYTTLDGIFKSLKYKTND
jgi:hypothetical protein